MASNCARLHRECTLAYLQTLLRSAADRQALCCIDFAAIVPPCWPSDGSVLAAIRGGTPSRTLRPIRRIGIQLNILLALHSRAASNGTLLNEPLARRVAVSSAWQAPPSFGEHLPVAFVLNWICLIRCFLGQDNLPADSAVVSSQKFGSNSLGITRFHLSGPAPFWNNQIRSIGMASKEQGVWLKAKLISVFEIAD